MPQAKVTRELESLRADLASTDVHEWYLTCSKSKVHSTVQNTKEHNVLPPQKPCHNKDDNALAGAATALSLLSPSTDNFNSQQCNQHHMKCYYDCTHGCFLDYLNDPILDGAVIYVGDIPFQYNKAEVRYTEFIGGYSFYSSEKRP